MARLRCLSPRAHAAREAQGKYPERPIKIIVPFPPGGGVDLTARLLAEPLAQRTRPAVVVENRGGAGGMIGVEAMAHARPTATRSRSTGAGTLTAGPHLRRLPYDPDGARAHHAAGAHALHRRGAQRPAGHDLPEFMALAREHELRWASGGIGTSQHLAGELFTQMSGAAR